MRVFDGPMLVIGDPPASVETIGVAVNSLRMVMDLPQLLVRDVLGRVSALVMVDRYRVVFWMEDP